MPLTDAPERSDVYETQLESPQRESDSPAIKRLIVAIPFVVIALLVVFLACLKPGSSDGYLFRVMAGQVISEKGIPATDPFTWTSQGQPFYLDGWLACLFFFQLNSHLPSMALVIYKGAVPSLIAALVLWRALRRSKSWPISIGAALLAGLALSDWARVNQQMITYVIFAALLLALDRYREGGARFLPFALPPIFVLWGNLNSGAVIGIALILIWAIGEALSQADSPFRKRQFIGAVIISALAVAANPYGFKIYSYEAQLLGNLGLINAIDPDSHSLRLFQVFLIGTPIAMILSRKQRAWGTGDALMLTAMAVGALLLNRNVAPFAIAAAPVAAGAIAAALRGWSIPVIDRSAVKLLGAACAVGVLGFLVVLKYPRVDRGTLFKYTFRTGTFPQAGAKHLITGKYPGLLFNDYDWGGYMTWKLWPKQQVFVDPRPDLFMVRGAYDDGELIESTGPGWQQALDRLGVQVVLTHKRGQLGKALLLDHGWKMSFYGPAEALFTRVPAS